MKYLKFKGMGKEYSDCTAEHFYEVVGNPTVRELCDDIITNKGEWGYIGIHNKDAGFMGGLFGDPCIEYYHGIYVDENRKEIQFNIPDECANKKVVRVRASGGWSCMNYLLEVEE